MSTNIWIVKFFPKKPNWKLVTDTTEFSLFGQKMYLSPALDSHNSYLVGYTLSDQSALDMAPPMLEKAHTSIPDEIELIFHSNQGWQCPRKQY